MELYTTLQKKVLDLEKTKTTQANEIASLKRRVKKLEKKRSSRTHKLKRLYKVGLTARVESSGGDEDLEERLTREKAKKEKEANIALTEEWDDIQAKIEDDHELAQRMQAEEQKELSVEEKAKLFQQLFEQKRKHFAAKRAEEKRNKPPTQAQQRKIIYEEEVTIDAIPLVVKSPRIVYLKIHKEGKKSYYKIIRADGKSQMYMIFSHMLKSFDKEDLETLYKLVKANYGNTVQWKI
ncbi:hypothetical protein Tco_0199016 [Tanacetum coccineum]